MSSLPAILLAYENTTRRPSLAHASFCLQLIYLQGQGYCSTLFSENRGDKRFNFSDQVVPVQEKNISLKGSSSHNKSKTCPPNPNPSQWGGSGCLLAPPVYGHTLRLSSHGSGLYLGCSAVPLLSTCAP